MQLVALVDQAALLTIDVLHQLLILLVLALVDQAVLKINVLL